MRDWERMKVMIRAVLVGVFVHGCVPPAGSDPSLTLARCTEGHSPPILLAKSDPGRRLSWTRFGNSILVEARDFDQDVGAWFSETSLVEPCGEAEILLAPRSIEESTSGFAVVGEWLLRCRERGAIDIYEVDEGVTSRRLFESTSGCELYPVGGGLAAVDPNSRELLFHDEPLAATGPPRVVSTNVRLPEYKVCSRHELVDCWTRADEIRTIGFGDHLVVAHQNVGVSNVLFPASLTIVDPKTGAQELLTEWSSRVFRMEDGVHALFTGTFAGDDWRGNHELVLYESQARSAEVLATSGGWRTAGMWVDPHINTVAARQLDLLHVPSGARYEVTPADHWQLLPSTGAVLLLRVDGTEDRSVRYFVEAVTTGERRSLLTLDAPRLGHVWVDRVNELVFAAETRTIHPWDGSAPVLAQPVSLEELVASSDLEPLHLEPLGVSTPIVLFDRDRRLAWELTFEGDAEIIERRGNEITIIHADPSSSLWRIDL